MRQAESVLISAQRLGTLNRSFYHLGELYTDWAAQEADPVERSELAKKASQALARAIVFEPNTESVWADSAQVDEVFLGRKEEALKKRARAQDLVRQIRGAGFRQDPAAFAEYYLAKCRSDLSLALEKGDALQATVYFEMAITNAVSFNERAAALDRLNVALVKAPENVKPALLELKKRTSLVESEKNL
jgi:hypothetical protein